ncbi:MAG: TonB-dependent receptor, partial [Rhodothermales bacterium]|nr:TonB-dependent receptor [Rhodothermales bacterium]
YSAGGGVAYNRGIHALPHDTWSREASVRLDAAPAEGWSLTGVGRFLGVESNHPVRDPGATRVPLDPNARLERDRWVGTAEARWAASPRWSHRVKASLFRQDFTFEDERDDIAQPPDFFVSDATFTFGADLLRTTAEYLARWTPPAPFDLDLAMGAQWEREDLANELRGDFGDTQEDLDRASGAAFVDVHATPHPRLSVLAGARVERWEGLDAEATPRAAAVVQAVPGLLSLRVAAGRAYKVPNLQEQFTDNAFLRPNPDIAPETSVSWEVGADVEAEGGLSLGATAFRQTYRNLIRTVPLEDEERFQNRNVGRSRAWGVEGSLRWRASARVALGLDATRTWTEVLDNTGLSPEQYPRGDALPFRPTHVASALARVRAHPRVEVLLRATRVGSQVVLSERFGGRRVGLDPYARVDATVDLALGGGRTLYLRVDNVTDTDYMTAFDRPGLPATAVVGLRVR